MRRYWTARSFRAEPHRRAELQLALFPRQSHHSSRTDRLLNGW